jgi:signal transduction histidine kinase
LVHTIITLKLAKRALAGADGPAAELVDEALVHAERATAELRELVRGNAPAALRSGGLRAGIDSLVGHVDVPVRTDVLPERLPATVETTAYFVVAEALTNVVKHAGAGSASVNAAIARDALHLEVRDDGVGGADYIRGSGLAGLAERVADSGGTITVASPLGKGTTIVVELPIGRDWSAGPPESSAAA